MTVGPWSLIYSNADSFGEKNSFFGNAPDLLYHFYMLHLAEKTPAFEYWFYAGGRSTIGKNVLFKLFLT